mgnify:CR=1 FL=1
MFGKKNHVDIELNADVERLLKSAKEGVLPIVEAGEPVLREQCVRYDGQLSKHTLHKLIETMHKTMLDAPGVGSGRSADRPQSCHCSGGGPRER